MNNLNKQKTMTKNIQRNQPFRVRMLALSMCMVLLFSTLSQMLFSHLPQTYKTSSIIQTTVAKTKGIKSVTANVKIYGTTSKVPMIDHIVLKYSAKVKLPKSLSERKKLYSFQDCWFGGKRKVTNVYTNSKGVKTKNGKSKPGAYVIVQFQKIKNPVYTTAAFNKGLHAGQAVQFEQENNITYKRFNCEKTIIFRQNKAIYSTKGKCIQKAGKIKIKSSNLKWDKETLPKKLTKQMSYTVPVPFSYKYSNKKAEGTIETITYQTKDYYRKDGKTYQKKVLVYLPYDYQKNKTKRYPILYYMHGTGGSEEGGRYLKSMFDSMIENQLIEPMIIAFPTFYTNNPTKDKNIGYHQEDVYDQEFRNELMIAVESKYRTFAKSTSEADLVASRDHRAFTGLSAGSFITWQTFLDNSQYVRYYIPLAGHITNNYDEKGSYISHDTNMKNAIETARRLRKQGMEYSIIECCGTIDDEMTKPVQKQYETLTKEQDVFDFAHYKLLWIEGAKHEQKAFDDGIFNALPQVFPGKKFK